MSIAGNISEVKALLTSLQEFTASCIEEERDRVYILDFLQSHSRPFDRAHLDAHLTASALVVDSAGERILLGLHRKLNRWLQVGGHGEPDEVCAMAVAFREAFEESSIAGLVLYPGAPQPFDVDVHQIPARGEVTAHLHLDIRYLLLAPVGATVALREEEHLQMRWWTWGEAENLDLDPSLRRMIRKAQQLTGAAE